MRCRFTLTTRVRGAPALGLFAGGTDAERHRKQRSPSAASSAPALSTVAPPTRRILPCQLRELLSIFQDVEDPRRGNAKCHDLHEMLAVALLSMLTGGRTCVDMEDFGCAAEPFLRKFLTLAQVEVDGKSNEIPALPELLELADVKGRTVTADAMQRSAGRRRRSWPGRRLRIGAERNQSMLHEDAAERLDNPPESAELLSHQQVGKGHGRVEKRTATVCHDVGWPQERHDWPGLSAIGKVVAERRLADGRESMDVRYCLLSAKLPAEQFGRVVRSRWAIENGLHWVLDVSMDEDQARNRKGNSAACLVVVRRLAQKTSPGCIPTSGPSAASSSMPSATTTS